MRIFMTGFVGWSMAGLAASGAVSALSGAALEPRNPWADMARSDIDFMQFYIEAQDIDAVYPRSDLLSRRLRQARMIVEPELARTNSFGGYSAVLRHFVNQIDDEHTGVSLSLTTTQMMSPGFLLTYQGGRYVVATSEPGDPLDGQELSDCDGKPIGELVTEAAKYSGGHVGLESTKASAAVQLLVDSGNPFLQRPSVCSIGGKSITLNWTRLSYADYLAAIRRSGVYRDTSSGSSSFGKNGVWVHLGTFEPQSRKDIDQFSAAIKSASDLRDKDVIVIDVRRNPGGSYNWYMAFLRSLYGNDYANYYARSRLSIAPVFRATPEIRDFLAADDGVKDDPTPPDPDNDRTNSGPAPADGVKAALAAGQSVYHLRHLTPSRSGSPPFDPVKARVYVLTDYGCSSACIAFADEMKAFPGVVQVGVDTFVDNRTGTPFSRKLPSGNGTVYVPVMTRDGRARGDNIPVHPDFVFPGNIADTKAVQAWLETRIFPQVRNRS